MALVEVGAVGLVVGVVVMLVTVLVLVVCGGGRGSVNVSRTMHVGLVWSVLGLGISLKSPMPSLPPAYIHAPWTHPLPHTHTHAHPHPTTTTTTTHTHI